MTETGTEAAVATYKHRTTCRACGKLGMKTVLDLGNQFLPRFVPEVDETLPRAPLVLVRCSSCGLLQLNSTVSPDLLYRQFWYESGINESMKQALRDVVKTGLAYNSGGVWLDIGANDGYLLSQVPKTFQRVAVEPALNFKARLEEFADMVIPDYFHVSSKFKKSCDVITSVAMFYDLDSPGDFLEAIAESLHPRGVWINQLNDSPTMLKTGAFDGICHEHLCYYDIRTLNSMYEEHGLRIVSISHNQVNGGSIRVVAKKAQDGMKGPDLSGIPEADSEAFGQQVTDFAEFVRRWKPRMRRTLEAMGTGWCYGASTKGTAVLQYLEPIDNLIAVADRNPTKHGLKMAGSWLPIRSEDEMRQALPMFLFCLPWAFKSEFNERERHLRALGTPLIYPLPDIEICV